MSLMLHNMFPHLLPVTPMAADLLERILRPIAIYVFLIAALRLAGKRELAQLNPFDLVVLLTLSNTVQNAIIGTDTSVSGGIIAATTLLIVNYFLVRFVSRHETIERLIEGDPDVLIENGRVKADCLKREAISELELVAAAHKQGFDSLEEIDRAVLDTNGALTFFAKKPNPDLTRHNEIMKRLDQLTAQLEALKA
jgi:uncharacterized membrane protein YcaP (DUF421 family)